MSVSNESDAPSYLTLASGASIAYRRRLGKPQTGGASLPGIVFLSGLNSDMTGTKATALDAICAERGQAFLRFDYEGHGASSGRFDEGTVGLWRDDSLAVFDQLTEGPQILVGSSLGGWLMLLLALARPERVVGLVGIAQATDSTEELMWKAMPPAWRERLLADGRIIRPSDYDPDGYVITRDLIEEGRSHLLLGSEIPLTCPVRLLHGDADKDVPWQHSMRLAEKLASRDVVVTIVKGGDHRLSSESDIARIAAAVAEVSKITQSV